MDYSLRIDGVSCTKSRWSIDNRRNPVRCGSTNPVQASECAGAQLRGHKVRSKAHCAAGETRSRTVADRISGRPADDRDQSTFQPSKYPRRQASVCNRQSVRMPGAPGREARDVKRPISATCRTLWSARAVDRSPETLLYLRTGSDPAQPIECALFQHFSTGNQQRIHRCPI